MWSWLPPTWRIPIWVKFTGAFGVLVMLFLYIPLESLNRINRLIGEQQELQLQESAGAFARLLGEQARGIEASVQGVTMTRSVERNWSAWREAIDESFAGSNQLELQKAIVESQIVSVLDYLALVGPQGDLYLAHGGAETYNTPIPSGSLLRQLSLSTYAPEQAQRPRPSWTWGLEHHPPSSPEGSGPFLMVGGPVYLPDLTGQRWRYAGCIVGGRRLVATSLGSMVASSEGEPMQVLLGHQDGSLIWSTLSPTADPDRLLADFRAQDMLQPTIRPYWSSVGGTTHLVSVVDLGGIPEQAPQWKAGAPLLIAMQPENRSSMLLSDFREGVTSLAIGIILSSFLLSPLLALQLSRPLTTLTAAVERYARGEQEIPQIPVPPTRDELESLGQAFNAMVVQRQEADARRIRAEKLAVWRDIAQKLAHEIKNPLQPIRLHIELLARIAKRNPDAVAAQVPEAAELILIEVERLKHLADDFSNFARMPLPMLAPCPVEPLLCHAIELMQPQWPGIPMTLEPVPNLPPYALDAEKLSQVLVNLLKNAAEALQDGASGEPGIVLRVEEQPDGGLVLSVTDTGPGISEEAQPRLFTMYYTTKEEGSGLGLAMVQQIMLEHGGQATVESAVGVGTTFRLYFPASLRLTPQALGPENAPPPDEPGADESAVPNKAASGSDIPGM